MIANELDSRLIDALFDPGRYPHPVESVKLLETHISWVLLAGEYAYKIKKPVNFGFLDFSELSARQFFCHEELRLNRRLAPALYLDVVGIGGSVDQPIFGAESAFEYAVKMRRFAEEMLLSHLLEHRLLRVADIQNLAATMAGFHGKLPSAAIDGDYGNPEAVAQPARQNFLQLSRLLDRRYAERLENLRLGNEKEYQRCRAFFDRRLQDGRVRECHGDLHLGNIVMLGDSPTPFDGIEFNPNLRWIDVVNDIAFLLMDLQHRQRPDLAFAFINAYLEIGGDYEGLVVLRFYLGYRAMVMAKVTAIRAAQLGRAASLSSCESYLGLAEQFYSPSRPALMITYGLPGCGKTMVSQIVIEKFRAIRLRSDVERKRLFGIPTQQRSHSAIDGGIYTSEATERTYEHLLMLCRLILQGGFNVIVDAAFLKHQERRQFQGLARALNLPFAILAISCDDTAVRERIFQRHIAGSDASEADVAVYEKLKGAAEALTADELGFAIGVTNDSDIAFLSEDAAVWEKVEKAINERQHRTDSPYS
ncbi:MAG: AAA family ATPase [Methylomonas sp.]|nr:AAA family ATPase [Methylomonas sp.]